MDYTAHEAGVTAPDSFVIRWRGILCRAKDGLPLLFPTMDAAKAEAEKLANGKA
jgi:hypothetical protein